MSPTVSTPPLRFDGQVAIVTGAGRGLGREHALLLASRGAQVVVNELVDDDIAGAVVDEIRRAGGQAVASLASVTTEDGAESIAGAALEAFGRIDIVVNNAGISDAAPFPEMTAKAFSAHLAVHLVGSFNVTRAAWPSLATQRYGRVVMTTSTAGFTGIATNVAYAAAKSGVVGLTRALANAGAPVGIKVNALAPMGYTRMIETVAAARGHDPEYMAVVEENKRLRPASLVSPLVAALCHGSCDASGEIFFAGGGRVARDFIAETRGIAVRDLRPDVIAARWEEIVDETGYHVISDVFAHSEFCRQNEPPPAPVADAGASKR